jgi:hypothetical protein
MSSETRSVVVRMPLDLYTAVAQLAVKKKTSTSSLLCEGARDLLTRQGDVLEAVAQLQNPGRPMGYAPTLGLPQRRDVCTDPDKMHGAADGFPGSDEGSQYDPKKL